MGLARCARIVPLGTIRIQNPMIAADDIEHLRLQRSFRRIWAVAFGVAIASAIPVVLLKHQAPWVVAVPICLGVLLGLFLELRDDFGKEIRDLEDDVATLSSEFKGLLDYTGKMVLEVPSAKQDKGQTLFSFLQPDKTIRRKMSRVRLDSGEEIFVINCDRYVDLLVSKLLEDSDKVVEHSLTMASKRFGAARPEQLTQKGFLTKTILETLKADFRGNWITVVSRNAERVIRDLEKSMHSDVTLVESKKHKSA